MSNIFDYIKWRGDLSFEQDSLNPVDALILSRLAYLPFDGIAPGSFDEVKTLRQIGKEFESADTNGKILWPDDPALLTALAGSRRFGTLPVRGYTNKVDSGTTMQFSAVVFSIEEKLNFIAYRGTDNTVVGWNEDFNMYCNDTLPSHDKALEYLSHAAEKLDGSLILGGHSKGGNLAMYSAEFCKPDIRARITDLFNFDGPGLNRSAVGAENYDEIKNRVHTYIPQSSVFGIMFVHDEDFSIVQSTQKSFMQHDVYSWELCGRDFLYMHERTNSSYFINHTLNDLIENMTVDERTEFINGVFGIISSSKDETFDEIASNWRSNSAAMLKSLLNLDKQTRSVILSTLGKLIKSAKENFSDINPLKKQKRS